MLWVFLFWEPGCMAFYRKQQPGEELHSFTDSQFISAVLSCVVNCIAQSPSTTEALCLCVKGQKGSLKPNMYFLRSCIRVIKADSLSFCHSPYAVLGWVCVNWQICVRAWYQSGQQNLEPGLGLNFGVSFILFTKFGADQTFIELFSRSRAGGCFSSCKSGGVTMMKLCQFHQLRNWISIAN